MRSTGGGSPLLAGAAAALVLLGALIPASANRGGPEPGAPAPERAAGREEAGRSGGADAASARPTTDDLLGSWRPREYRLEDGEVLPVDGRIVFLGEDGASEGEWMVVFFVTRGDPGTAAPAGAPLRGSAEGGQFFRDGDTLTLTHAYHLSAGEAVGALPEAPLRMAMRSHPEAAENHREPCRFTIEGGRLTLVFPSGNSMVFARV